MGLPPDILEKLKYDISTRLGPDGLPLHEGNDYERHLYARKLMLEGLSREQVREALFQLDLTDIPSNKWVSYVEDITHSAIVGFPNPEGNLLPVYAEKDGILTKVGGD